MQIKASNMTIGVSSVLTIVTTVLGAYIHISGQIQDSAGELDARMTEIQMAVAACETRERALAKYEDTRDDLEAIRISIALIREKQEEQRGLRGVTP
jgi:hypothetical protein